MRSATMSRRSIVQAALALLAAVGVTPRARAGAAPPEIRLPEGVPVERVDFETKGIEGWTPVDGQWAVEDMAGAPSGTRALVQRATRNRSEEHTSELQSHSDLVCRLLLEKKKDIRQQKNAA